MPGQFQYQDPARQIGRKAGNWLLGIQMAEKDQVNRVMLGQVVKDGRGAESSAALQWIRKFRRKQERARHLGGKPQSLSVNRTGGRGGPFPTEVRGALQCRITEIGDRAERFGQVFGMEGGPASHG